MTQTDTLVPSPAPAPLEELPPPLRIVQIAAASGEPDVLFALANDGTVWRLAVRLNYTWARLPDLPTADAPPGRDTPSPPI